MTARTSANIATLGLILTSATPLCTVAESLGRENGLAARVGIYHWAGKHTKGVDSGVRDLLNLNAHIVRIALSARMDIDYNRGKDCIAGFTLPSTLKDEDVRRTLVHPGLKVIMITAYDGAGFGDCATHSYLSSDFYTQPNTAKMVDEYSEFVYRLHTLLRNTGKRVILANWEGDNDVYCGHADAYAGSDEFREWCLGVYPAVYGGNRSPHDSIEGMVLWMKARHLGLTLGRERARREGITGVEVMVAPEVSAVHMLHDAGFESVLYDVVPRVEFDYVSYSCYESLTRSDPFLALTADLKTIRSVAASDRVIVGELGYGRAAAGDRLLALTEGSIDAAIAGGADYIIQWNLYDQDETTDFGLFDVRGDLTSLGHYYREALSEGRPRPAMRN